MAELGDCRGGVPALVLLRLAGGFGGGQHFYPGRRRRGVRDHSGRLDAMVLGGIGDVFIYFFFNFVAEMPVRR